MSSFMELRIMRISYQMSSILLSIPVTFSNDVIQIILILSHIFSCYNVYCPFLPFFDSLCLFLLLSAQSTGAVEYSDCISAERKDTHNKYPDMKQSDGEASVLELWGMWSSPSLPLLPGPLWPRVVVPVRVLSMVQIELFNHLVYLKPFNCVQTSD